MELHVFFRGPLPTKAALARQMRDLGFPLSLKSATGSLEQQTGLMPMRWQREDTGVEFDVWSTRIAIDEIRREGVDPAFDRSANFRWGGEDSELLCALCAAAALAKLTGGIVFDPEEDRLQSIEEAVETARATLQRLAKPDKPPGTTVSDLRRYLKPLLKQRSDLLLTGRLLMIRPLRHVVRGALFEGRHGHFYLHSYVGPAYGGTAKDFDHINGTSAVWEPNYQPLLMDSLREDIFDEMGQIMNLSDYAEHVAARERRKSIMVYDQDARFLAHLLGGDRDAAVAYMEEKASSWSATSEWIVKWRSLLDGDILSLCEEYRAKEAVLANAHKLGSAWEPSPFPVELPKADRAAKSDEHRFVTKPWIETPPNLIGAPPDRPGEIAFGRSYHPRKMQFVIEEPLEREQAQALHLDDQKYCLLVRLPNGAFLALSHHGWNPHEPKSRRHNDSAQGYYLDIYGKEERLHAWFNRSKQGLLALFSIDVLDLADRTRSLWIHFDHSDQTKSIRVNEGYQGHASGRREEVVMDTQKSFLLKPFPNFGDYENLLGRVNSALQECGFLSPFDLPPGQ
jgi:hypothetical protein